MIGGLRSLRGAGGADHGIASPGGGAAGRGGWSLSGPHANHHADWRYRARSSGPRQQREAHQGLRSRRGRTLVVVTERQNIQTAPWPDALEEAIAELSP